MKLTTLSILALSLFALSACQNTVHGFGEDLEKAGKNIQGQKTSSNSTAPQPTTTTSNSASGYNYNTY
ncbi:MAG: entericidin A/B family lipoprotein [Pseudobdellovibrionaceae bacterium]